MVVLWRKEWTSFVCLCSLFLCSSLRLISTTSCFQCVCVRVLVVVCVRFLFIYLLLFFVRLFWCVKWFLLWTWSLCRCSRLSFVVGVLFLSLCVAFSVTPKWNTKKKKENRLYSCVCDTKRDSIPQFNVEGR